MKKRSNWTPDEREFDRILSLMESLNQLDRIRGRSEYRPFAERFTPEQLAAMAEAVGAKKVGKS